MTYSLKEAVELFEILASMSVNSQIMLEGASHSSSVFCNADGSYCYYDSNVRYRPPNFNGLQVLIERILNSHFIPLHAFSKENKIELTITLLRYPCNAATITVARQYMITTPCNFFSPVHQAIIHDDHEALPALFKSDLTLINSRDRAGLSPYEMALINNKRNAMVQMHKFFGEQPIVRHDILFEAITHFANDALLYWLQSTTDDFKLFLHASKMLNYFIMNAMFVNHRFDQAQVHEIRELLDAKNNDELRGYFIDRQNRALGL